MGKILITAEKPDASKNIASILGVPTKNLGGYFENDSYIVTWAIGHLIKWKTPEEINKDWKVWSLDPLPFKFDIEKDLTVDPSKKTQYSVMKKLINRADVSYIVNAGDADREGLLIQEEIYKFCGNKKPIKMLWTQSLTESEILKCMAHLKERSLFLDLLEEAKARSTVDYMLGITYTRAIAKTLGNNNYISYGRCQTPLLKLLADREVSISNFKSTDFYTIKAKYDKGFIGTLIDDEKKTLKLETEASAKNIINSLSNPCKIESITEKQQKEQAPLLFSLPSLQKYMGKKYKFSPEKTLEIAQSLYEKKLTTYPRTDTEYINEDVYNEIKEHIDPACTVLNIDKSTLNDISCLKRIVQDKKVTGHHALLPTEIIPTKKQLEELSSDEKLVYEAICKEFIALFMPDYEYITSTIIVNISGKKFISKGKRVIKEGYKALYKKEKIEKDEEDNVEDEQDIPELKEGDTLNATFSVNKDKTKPEARYTGATIISLMEKNHIGTPATMGEIIKTLIKRGYIEYTKNKYSVTNFGLDFINIVPEELKDPKLEKEFEEKLELIGNGKLTYNAFIEEVYNNQKQEIEKFKTLSKDTKMQGKEALSETDYKCPFCNSKLTEMKFSYNCDCGFKVSKEICSKKLSETQIKELTTKKRTSTIKGFKSKAGKSFDAKLVVKDDKTIGFEFN